MDKLSPEARQILVLWEQEERSFEEIGRLLGRSPNTIRSKWLRAISQLQDQLVAEPEERCARPRSGALSTLVVQRKANFEDRKVILQHVGASQLAGMGQQLIENCSSPPGAETWAKNSSCPPMVPSGRAIS